LIIAIDILLIIFGAIFFLEILKKNKVTESLAVHLDNFSSDIRVQVIMLAWFLENFLEGIAGFGTPSTVVAPLLIVLGISPLKAVILALLGNSTSVPFGAVGTPIRIGFAGINIDPISIASTTALYNFVGLLVPSFMLWVLVSSKENRFTLFKQALPFALWSGIAFVIPSYLVSLFGIEFPSILGSIFGVILVVITGRLGIFTPKPIYHNITKDINDNSKPLSLKMSILPYALFIVLLILAKFLLLNLTFSIPWLSYNINIFNPGFVFIISTLIVAFYSKISWSQISKVSQIAFNKSIEPFLVIFAMSAVVQLMNNSANITRQIPSITQTLSMFFRTQFLPVLAPFIGAIGSFITGSATVSNLMFAPSIYSSSLFLGLDPVKILALTVVGAGAGNMIALADVLVAKTVAGVTSGLRDIILLLLPFCVIYLVLVALLGYFL
jgi:lactate permease